MQLGFTPLLQASQDGHLGVVKALVEHDPEMDLDKTTKVIFSIQAYIYIYIYTIAMTIERLDSHNDSH